MKPLTILPVLLTLLIAALFFAVSAGPAVTGQGSQIQANSFTASKGIQPFMSMNTNITWSTFNNGWNALEYNNGTANLTLNAGLNNFYNNPITVNESDIIATGLQKPIFGKTQWYNTTNWNEATDTFGFPTNGATVSIANSTKNGQNEITITGNSTKAGGSGALGYYFTIPISDLPSSNFAYNYITITGYNHVSQNVAGYEIQAQLFNNSNNGIMITTENGTVAKGTPANNQNMPFL